LHAARASGPFREELARHERLTARSSIAPVRLRGRSVSGVFPAPGAGRDERRGRFEMRLCPRVHLKAVIVDGGFLYLGSANWTGAGLGAKGVGRRNFELGVVTDDAPLLDDVQDLFDGIWRGSECGGCKLRDVCPRPLDGHGAKAVGMRVGRR
jgi:phosphatidylserine/phosphatidylglycerophosphate/cardiolipin synthase-like enzyme